jgi:2-polyprenyl-6-methoxyphenol hydroxylase-like FAD-dependent oxidoreductase
VEKHYDILIVGGGLVGQVTALACAKLQNLSVALVDSKKIFDSKKMRADGRAYALSASSLKLLKHLKIDIAEHLQPITF